MNKVGLRFLLTDGSFLMTVLPLEEAKQIVDGFLACRLNHMIGNAKGEAPWAVRVANIIGIHAVDLRQLQVEQPAVGAPVQPYRLFPPGASGLPN